MAWRLYDEKLKKAYIVLVIKTDFSQEFKHFFSEDKLQDSLTALSKDPLVYDFHVYKRCQSDYDVEER